VQPTVLRTNAVQASPAATNDYYGWPNVSLQAVVTGAATYSVEVTLDNPLRPPAAGVTWFPCPIATLVGASTNQLGALQDFVLGIRLNQTAGAGSVALTIIQVGGARGN